MPTFHALRVAAVEELTEDARLISLDVPTALREEYRFTPGQHLTFAHAGPDGPVRRTFSICTTPASGRLSVALRLLPDGVFSRFVAEELRAGNELSVMTPVGRFAARARPGNGPRTIAAVVAGSGITPVLSIITDRLETEPDTRVVLWYGNRRSSSVMFGEELADLKDRFLPRLELTHVLSAEDHGSPLTSGRIDRDKLETLLRMHPGAEVDEWFVCGPLGLLELTRAVLAEHDVPSDRVHREVFFTGAVPAAPPPAADHAPGGSIRFTLAGRTGTANRSAGGSVLDAVLAVRPDAPYACRSGVCGTCRMKVLDGEVRMAQNYALEPRDLEGGFRLACQSVPQTPTLVVDFDA